MTTASSKKIDQTLPARVRIKRRVEFLNIQSRGEKVSSRHFLICLQSRAENETESRVGVTITTKVHKRANKRNYVKRSCREVFRRLRHGLKEVVDVVIIARNGSTELEFEAIQTELIKGLQRVGLLAKNFTAA